MSKESVWIFGYGSLIWRPNFQYLRSEEGVLSGWNRVFYQGSPDHRGTPECPGCVATIVCEPRAQCFGRLYLIEQTEYARVFSYLDKREAEGYQRLLLWVTTLKGERIEAVVYVASAQNPHFLDGWSISDLAVRIRVAVGPSGSNLEYFWQLYNSLEAFGFVDEHLQASAKELRVESPSG